MRHLSLALFLLLAVPTLAQTKVSTAYQMLLSLLRTDPTWQLAQEPDRRRGDEVLRTATVLFHTDTAGKRSGPAVALYDDGYMLLGEYTDGEREGVWNLRPIDGKGKIFDIHYYHGAAIAVANAKQIRRKEQPRATRIPLVY